MTTLNLQVSASADDASENTGVSVALTAVNIRNDATYDWSGIRFQNVTISNGATINSATHQIYVSYTSNDDINVNIYADDTDSAAQFTTTLNDISARTRTAATVSRNATAVGAGWYTLPDAAALVQEVVNRAGWISGNSLALLLETISGSDLRYNAYDGSTTEAAKLDIDYTTGPAERSRPALRPAAAPRPIHQLRI